MKRLIFLFALIWLLPKTAFALSYDYYLTGSAIDVATSTDAGLMLMGGGTDVDAAFEWLIDKSGGGDVVVIRASGSDGYNPYIYGLGTVDSVETIVFNNQSAANNVVVHDIIANAEALFIAGGDQWDYVDFWDGSLVEDAIHTLVARDVPIGGTSAGLAVLGEFVFSAENGTVYPDEMLENPYNQYATFEDDLFSLPLLTNTITDSHFSERDRMGRLLGFLCRIVADGWSPDPIGIGVDEATALLVESNSSATVVGSGDVYVVQTPGAPEQCAPNQTLTYLDLFGWRLEAGDVIDLHMWGSSGEAFLVSAENETITYATPTAIQLQTSQTRTTASNAAFWFTFLLIAVTLLILRGSTFRKGGTSKLTNLE